MRLGAMIMDVHHWAHPDWVYVNKRPTMDDAYFENLTRVLNTAGLNWNTIETKWGGFKKAFQNFSVEKVSRFTEKDVERLMGDAGIVRNKAKITATISNAIQMMAIRKEYGSFQSYLDSLDKADNYSKVVADLIKRFRHVGRSTAEIFLWSVGEKVSPTW
jgi:DNA-3-methyladenine glycosylase I